MSLSTLISTPCTITRRSASTDIDPYGDEIPAEATATTVCALQQTMRMEPDAETDLSSTTWMLFLPTGTVFGSGDVATIDGEDFEAIGEPWDATDGTPAVWHVEATVKRVAGSEDT